MKTYIINKKLSYNNILEQLNKAHIPYYIDKNENIILLENTNKTLIHPHKMYISKNLSIYIDRYCSYDIYTILTLLLKLYANDVIEFERW